ncbi:MAG: hypothetical protein ACE10E_00545, partial [Acidiferrobacterales bacterium]
TGSIVAVRDMRRGWTDAATGSTGVWIGAVRSAITAQATSVRAAGVSRLLKTLFFGGFLTI